MILDIPIEFAPQILNRGRRKLQRGTVPVEIREATPHQPAIIVDDAGATQRWFCIDNQLYREDRLAVHQRLANPVGPLLISMVTAHDTLTSSASRRQAEAVRSTAVLRILDDHFLYPSVGPVFVLRDEATSTACSICLLDSYDRMPLPLPGTAVGLSQLNKLDKLAARHGRTIHSRPEMTIHCPVDTADLGDATLLATAERLFGQSFPNRCLDNLPFDHVDALIEYRDSALHREIQHVKNWISRSIASFSGYPSHQAIHRKVLDIVEDAEDTLWMTSIAV